MVTGLRAVWRIFSCIICLPYISRFLQRALSYRPFTLHQCQRVWVVISNYMTSGDQEVEPSSQIMQLQIADKLSVICYHIMNANQELGGLATTIPPFAKLLWLVILGVHMSTCIVCVNIVRSVKASSHHSDRDDRSLYSSSLSRGVQSPAAHSTSWSPDINMHR